MGAGFNSIPISYVRRNRATYQLAANPTPDRWHRVAIAWNWDNPVDVLIWIAQQEFCDKATAQAMFQMAEPYPLLQYPNEATARSYLGPFTLCKTIAAKWNAGQYLLSEIASIEDILV